MPDLDAHNNTWCIIYQRYFTYYFTFYFPIILSIIAYKLAKFEPAFFHLCRFTTGHEFGLGVEQHRAVLRRHVGTLSDVRDPTPAILRRTIAARHLAHTPTTTELPRDTLVAASIRRTLVDGEGGRHNIHPRSYNVCKW